MLQSDDRTPRAAAHELAPTSSSHQTVTLPPISFLIDSLRQDQPPPTNISKSIRPAVHLPPWPARSVATTVAVSETRTPILPSPTSSPRRRTLGSDDYQVPSGKSSASDILTPAPDQTHSFKHQLVQSLGYPPPSSSVVYDRRGSASNDSVTSSSSFHRPAAGPRDDRHHSAASDHHHTQASPGTGPGRTASSRSGTTVEGLYRRRQNSLPESKHAWPHGSTLYTSTMPPPGRWSQLDDDRTPTADNPVSTATPRESFWDRSSGAPWGWNSGSHDMSTSREASLVASPKKRDLPWRRREEPQNKANRSSRSGSISASSQSSTTSSRPGSPLPSGVTSNTSSNGCRDSQEDLFVDDVRRRGSWAPSASEDWYSASEASAAFETTPNFHGLEISSKQRPWGSLTSPAMPVSMSLPNEGWGGLGGPSARRRSDPPRMDEQSHTNDDDSSESGRYVCPHCSKRFTRPSSLKIHIHSHTGEKPFNCQLCGRGFSVQSNLRRHLKIHRNAANKGSDVDHNGIRSSENAPASHSTIVAKA